MSPGYSLRRLLNSIPVELLIDFLPKDLKKAFDTLPINIFSQHKEKIIDTLDLNEFLLGESLCPILESLPKEKYKELLATAGLKTDISPTHAVYEFSDKIRTCCCIFGHFLSLFFIRLFSL